MDVIIFYIVAAISIACALTMITARKPVTSALFLVAVMFCLAVLFVLLDAHLIAVLQILIYAGAIMVLFMFVMMLLNLREKEGKATKHTSKLQVAGVAAMSLLLIPFMYMMTVGNPAGPGAMKGFGTTAEVGKLLYTDYLLPFEIASVLLLVALVGAVVLTKIKLR